MGREFGESNNYRQAELSKATGSAQQENKFSQGRAVDKIPCDCPQEAAVFTLPPKFGMSDTAGSST